jgi:AbrB family looped-hinge helix DNA binding protein
MITMRQYARALPVAPAGVRFGVSVISKTKLTFVLLLDRVILMKHTLVSSKYQVVIPKDVRERVSLKPGQKLIVFEKGGIIHLIPEIPVKKLRGMFKGRGLDSKDVREKKDREI